MNDCAGEKVQEVAESPTATSVQDSGVASSKETCTDETSIPVGHQVTFSLKDKNVQYVTSTPKKELQISGTLSNQAILPSKLILDDPLLSSIDEPGCDLTDHELESLVSDDDCEDVSTKVYNTKVKINLDSPRRKPSLSCFMDDVSTRPKMARSKSFSGPLTANMSEEIDPNSFKKNLFDIPVSPKLKSRVRERLYTLVNSIEGFKGKVSINEEEESKRLHSKTIGSVLDLHSQNEPLRRGSNKRNNFILSENCEVCTQSNMPVSAKTLSLNCTQFSSLNNSISERYGTAMSSLLETQLRQLQLHQEQLNQEKISFALQKKDEEVNTRISLYKDKLQEMIQLTEQLESKVANTEKKRQKDIRVYEDKLQHQEERHKKQLSLLHLECERKVHEAESRITVACEETVKSFDTKVLDILSENRNRLELVEKEHQSHIQQLNCVISKLRAEKRESELSRDANQENDLLVIKVKEISSERDMFRREVEEPRDRLKPVTDIKHKVSEQEEYISRKEVFKRKQEEELKIWKEDSEKWQQKFHSLQLDQQRLMDKALQELQLISQNEMENVKKEHSLEKERLDGMIRLLQEKISSAFAKNSSLRHQMLQMKSILKQENDHLGIIDSLKQEVAILNSRLEDSNQALRQERNSHVRSRQRLAEELYEIQELHRQELLKQQMKLEKERSSAVSQALLQQQEESQKFMSEMEMRYQELLNNAQKHNRAQIEEYRKAVRILKQRLKKTEGEIA